MNSEALELEYCPPLDPALFSAIVSDFDLSDKPALSSAREILGSLKASALEEDSSTFDPTGNSGHYADTEDNLESGVDEHSSEHNGSRSDNTDLSSLSNGVRSVHLSSDVPEQHGEAAGAANLSALDEATKVMMLQEMFPTATEYSIKHTLKKCNDTWDRALEELLNHAFFNDDTQNNQEGRISAKGIDAFSEDNGVYRDRKKKDKRKKKPTNRVHEEGRASSMSRPSTPSSWDKGRNDVELIASRTDLSTKMVSSVYHKNSASVTATLIALIDSLAASSGTSTPGTEVDAVIQAHAFELSKDFPSILPTHITGLVRLTHPSTVAAHELARAMTATGSNGRLEVIPRYAPVNLSDDEEPLSRRSLDSDYYPTSSHTTPDYRALATTHNAFAQRSFDQASAAYRRGRSDHLMSAAAGYYSQVGRDHASKRAEATAGAADALVASQSTTTELDLHGVSVKDAVRISKAKTENWWRGSNKRVMGLDGRRRNDEGSGGAFTIVTGIGRHSECGRGKLGPAVGKMLVSEGWHVSFGEGTLTVTGRRR